MREGKIDIFWFSGTGNTLKVVEAMAGVFRAAGREVRLKPLTAGAPSDPAPVLGLAFPVACQGTYPLVWDFCRKLPPGEGREVFMADTLAAFSGGIVGPLGRFLRRRGYVLLGAAEIVMPSNFFPREVPEDKLRSTREKAAGEARAYAEILLKGKSWWGRGFPLVSRLLGWGSRLSLTWRMMARLGRRLGIDPEQCTRCGLCARLCPAANIVLKELPVFGNSCIQCQRCLMLCPAGAVTVKGKPPVRYRAVTAEEMLRAESFAVHM